MSVVVKSDTDETDEGRYRLQEGEGNHSVDGNQSAYLQVEAQQGGCPGEALQDATPVRHKVS